MRSMFPCQRAAGRVMALAASVCSGRQQATADLDATSCCVGWSSLVASPRHQHVDSSRRQPRSLNAIAGPPRVARASGAPVSVTVSIPQLAATPPQPPHFDQRVPGCGVRS